MVVNRDIDNVDVYSIESDMKIRLCELHAHFGRCRDPILYAADIKKKLDEPNEEILPLAILELRERFQSNSSEVIVPFVPDMELPGVKFTGVPSRATKNACWNFRKRTSSSTSRISWKQLAILDPERHVNRILEQMKTDLRMTVLPEHIECFDNFQLPGRLCRIGLRGVSRRQAIQKDYRIFNVKTVVGPDDFATMEEVIHRRYRRMLDEATLPQLIVIDGGKGQLGAALKAWKGWACAEKSRLRALPNGSEEIYYPGDSLPLYIDKRSETLKVLQHMRDEGPPVRHHKLPQAPPKRPHPNRVGQIEGIGEKTAEALLMAFKSVHRLREAGERNSRHRGTRQSQTGTGRLAEDGRRFAGSRMRKDSIYNGNPSGRPYGRWVLAPPPKTKSLKNSPVRLK